MPKLYRALKDILDALEDAGIVAYPEEGALDEAKAVYSYSWEPLYSDPGMGWEVGFLTLRLRLRAEGPDLDSEGKGLLAKVKGVLVSMPRLQSLTISHGVEEEREVVEVEAKLISKEVWDA